MTKDTMTEEEPMVTDKERREAARELRGYGFDVLKDGSLLSTLKDVTGRSCWRDCLIALADLIEPQERTCRMTEVGSDAIAAGWYSCSECGLVFPPCNDEIAKWALRFCPHCGARVVNGDA